MHTRTRSLFFISLLFILAGCSSSSGPETNTNPTPGPGSISLGLLLAFTGPIEPLAPAMAAAAELAMAEVSDSGKLLGGTTVDPIRGDSTCINTAQGIEAFEQLIMDSVSGVVGANCSGVTYAIIDQAIVPSGMVMVSPSATSPTLSNIDDNGFFFRTATSDARQGLVLSQVILERNIQSVAVSYTNNLYGLTFHDAFKEAYEANGGAITLSAAHEDGKADYTDEVAALASAGGDALVVLGYYDQGGAGIIQESVNTNSFTLYALGDGMINDALANNIDGLTGSFGVAPGLGADFKETETFTRFAEGFDSSSQFAAESYDAAALILLAMQAAESTDPTAYKTKIFDVANAPGEKTYAGELNKALDLLAAGTDIDYIGASSVELIEPGESAGSHEELEVRGNSFVTVRVLGGQP